MLKLLINYELLAMQLAVDNIMAESQAPTLWIHNFT